MRAGARKESVESRGSTARNDGLHSFDGAGVSDGSSTSTQDSGLGTGGAFGGNEGGISQTTWFAPVDEISDCPGGVCPVPWATKTETNSIFTIEGGPILLGGDEVNHPDHYTDGAIECIEAIEAQLTTDEYRGYLKGNIAKYIWRERHKGELQSLKKAQWYLDRLVQTVEAQNG
jgi:hypothetical protein